MRVINFISHYVIKLWLRVSEMNSVSNRKEITVE
jgi:hypothetical protein